jgi:hypothetical protein
MKESYRQGVANLPDPESCGAHRTVCREALDRGTCGLSIELRKPMEWSVDAVRRSGRQYGQDRDRKNPDGSADSETSGTHGNSEHGNLEIPAAPSRLRQWRAGRRTWSDLPRAPTSAKFQSLKKIRRISHRHNWAGRHCRRSALLVFVYVRNHAYQFPTLVRNGFQVTLFHLLILSWRNFAWE